MAEEVIKKNPELVFSKSKRGATPLRIAAAAQGGEGPVRDPVADLMPFLHNAPAQGGEGGSAARQ